MSGRQVIDGTREARLAALLAADGERSIEAVDPDRRAVYEAEAAVKGVFGFGELLLSPEAASMGGMADGVDEVEAYLRRALDAAYPGVLRFQPVVVYDLDVGGLGRGGAGRLRDGGVGGLQHGDVIHLRRAGGFERSVLHELAHIVDHPVEGHGSTFRSHHVRLVDAAMGRDQAAPLVEAYVHRGLGLHASVVPTWAVGSCSLP